jgi:2-phospho-L-lactate/phosphoenolpyruvate guanylyltransferase
MTELRATGACVLIPVKARAHCKQRLAQALTPAQRLQLVRNLLDGVIAAARAANEVRQVIVVSPERDTLAADIAVCADAEEGLNSALHGARTMLLKLGCSELVILPADLPDVRAADIDALIHCGRTGRFALASDGAGHGTNALYLDTAGPFTFHFGLESCARHLHEARRHGLPGQLVHLPGLEFDIDTAADLERLGGRNARVVRWQSRLA